jgi:succinate-semialdehyde dehydrogenase / glutarate-semialdehyde dehydrogenase
MSFLKDSTLLQHQSYINGNWTDAVSKKTLEVTNPANGNLVAKVADCGAEETKQAITAADTALPAWRNKTALDRARILRKWNDLMLENADDLALLMTMEQGKPLAESKGEVIYGASFLEWFAEEGRRVYGDIVPPHAPNLRLLVTKQAIGVCAAITPWNFPIAMITRKCAPALAAGCTMVLKPSEETPLCALALAVLAERAGVPAGVFNVVVGKDAVAIGSELTSSKIVRKLSFTGSTPVGKLLMRQCAATVKKISLELGGNAPFIVLDDADLDAAVDGAILSKYRNAGQTCVCANRIFVQSGVYAAFLEKFTAAVNKQKVGNGTEQGITIGPLINEKAIEKVERLVADALKKGAKVLTGGKKITTEGNFFQPTVIADLSDDMEIMREEIFGPVAPVVKFETDQEVIDLANNTDAGLAAYFYGRDVGRIFKLAENLDYGMVGINTGLISTTVAPFGGMKESGLGREGSKYGIEDYLEIKYLCLAV